MTEPLILNVVFFNKFSGALVMYTSKLHWAAGVWRVFGQVVVTYVLHTPVLSLFPTTNRGLQLNRDMTDIVCSEHCSYSLYVVALVSHVTD